MSLGFVRRRVPGCRWLESKIQKSLLRPAKVTSFFLPPRSGGDLLVKQTEAAMEEGAVSVSYTHLTLPTIYSV